MNKLIDNAVNRFLAWKLPKDFGPDCGISFDGRGKDARGYEKTWPVGTNLFTAEQARAMFEYCLTPAAETTKDNAGIAQSVEPPTAVDQSGDPVAWMFDRRYGSGLSFKRPADYEDAEGNIVRPTPLYTIGGQGHVAAARCSDRSIASSEATCLNAGPSARIGTDIQHGKLDADAGSIPAPPTTSPDPDRDELVDNLRQYAIEIVNASPFLSNIPVLDAAAFDLPDLVRPKGVSRDQRSPCSLILSFPEVPTDDDMRAWHEADDTLAALRDERKDWARRFKLNGVTPWDWMTRAQEAEDDRERLTDDVAALVQQNIDLEARAERADASDAAWRILCGGKQKIIEQLEAERDVLRLDAERYRWLRDECRAEHDADIAAGIGWRSHANGSLDLWIDAARKA